MSAEPTRYTPEQIQLIHHALQKKAQDSFETSIRIVMLASALAKELADWQANLPAYSSVEREAEKVFSADLQAWLPQYEKLAALKIKEPAQEVKPRVLQSAMRILDLIPSTITKETSNEKVQDGPST